MTETMNITIGRLMHDFSWCRDMHWLVREKYQDAVQTGMQAALDGKEYGDNPYHGDDQSTECRSLAWCLGYGMIYGWMVAEAEHKLKLER